MAEMVQNDSATPIGDSGVAKCPACPAEQDQAFSKIKFFLVAKYIFFLLKRKFPILIIQGVEGEHHHPSGGFIRPIYSGSVFA